jgi:hypothetical protein
LARTSLVEVKNAGYGVPSWGYKSPLAVVLGIVEGITRLFALAEGVKKGVFAAGVLSDELVVDGMLSLLRERFDDVGEIETTG